METKNSMKKSGKKSRIPVRYVVTFLGFWGFFNVYALRVNLSVAMVAMVNNANHNNNGSAARANQCPELISHTTNATVHNKGPTYNWNSKDQALILGSFFYGYVLTQLPGGVLAEKIGGKWLFGGGILITAILSLLTPLAAESGTAAFVTVRVIEGLGEGVTMPAMNAIISRWAPTFERSMLSTVIYTGCQIGNVIAMPVSGYLSSSDSFGGWPSVFYVFGTIACIWFVFWAYFVSETPASHPTISAEELSYIQENQGGQKPHRSPPVPWRKLLTSIPLWALTLTHFGHSFGFLMFLTELPSYLSKLLHFDLKSNGLLSAVPYLVQAIAAWIASYVADRMRKSGRLTITTIRKLFNSIGLFCPAVCIFAITFSGCQPNVIVLLITLAMAANALTWSGYNVTHVDMSPDFAGTLYGITNTIANLCGVIGPAIVGYFTATGDTLENWNSVFYITTVVYILAAVIFIVFASAELQPWGLTSSSSCEKISEKPYSQSTLSATTDWNSENKR